MGNENETKNDPLEFKTPIPLTVAPSTAGYYVVQQIKMEEEFSSDPSVVSTLPDLAVKINNIGDQAEKNDEVITEVGVQFVGGVVPIITVKTIKKFSWTKIKRIVAREWLIVLGILVIGGISGMILSYTSNPLSRYIPLVNLPRTFVGECFIYGPIIYTFYLFTYSIIWAIRTLREGRNG